MSRRVYTIVVVLVVLGVIGGAYYYFTVGKGSTSEALGGSGTIEADQIAVTPQAQGRIIADPPEEGVGVKKGEVLYKLDPSIAALQVEQAKAGVRAARANYDNVRKDNESTSSEKAAAKAQWQQARVAQKMAETQLGYATVRSPIEGVLTNIAAHAGENAVPGNTLAVISTPASLTVTIFVAEDRIGEVRIGQDAKLTTDSSDKVYDARVDYIASQAEYTPASIETKEQRVKLVYQVKLRITNADAALKPGMPADVEIQ